MTILERKKRILEDLQSNRRNIILDRINSGEINKKRVQNEMKKQKSRENNNNK